MEKTGNLSNSAASKRGPTCSLSGSSSSEGEGSDHEDVPPSPCSSTSSGPTYVRPPGFKHHGQEIKAAATTTAVEQRPKVNVRIKRKIRRQSMMKDVLPGSGHVIASHPVAKVTAATATMMTPSKEEKVPVVGGATVGSAVQVLPPSGGMKTKVRKDPIPMRLRALPQSFWQQPNTVNSAPPGSMYSVLPPLCKMEQSNADLADIRPVTPPSDGEVVDGKEVPSLTLSDQPDIKKEVKERKDNVMMSDMDSLSLKLDLRDLKERDSSRDRDLSPRDRSEISPRERDLTPRDRDLTPRERDLTPRERDLMQRDRDIGKDRDLTLREKDNVREKLAIKHELRENGVEGKVPTVVHLPLEAKKKQPRPPPRIVRISQANTELLAKLFEGVDGEGKKKMVRRGRPKREYNPQAAALAAAAAAAAAAASASATSNASNNNNNNNAPAKEGVNAPSSSLHHPHLTGDDPYMIDSVAAGLLPMLTLETSRQIVGPSSQLSVVAIRGDNDRMLSLPALSVEQNHSAILTELVKAL